MKSSHLRFKRQVFPASCKETRILKSLPTPVWLPLDRPLHCNLCSCACTVQTRCTDKNTDTFLSSTPCHGVGALVGPPWSKRENGFIFSENVADGVKLYYEPHCDYQEDSFSDVPSVDAVITPASDQIIANAYPLVSGSEYRQRNTTFSRSRMQAK